MDCVDNGGMCVKAAGTLYTVGGSASVSGVSIKAPTGLWNMNKEGFLFIDHETLKDDHLKHSLYNLHRSKMFYMNTSK